MKRFLVIAAALLASSVSALAAGIVVPAEQRYVPFSGDLPHCSDSEFLGYIQGRFSIKETAYWNSSLQIVDIDKIKEIGFRSNGVQYIPRRYCVGEAHLNDLTTHKIIYQIQERTGFAGYNDGTEWCVIGLDRNLAYAPACAILKPLLDRYAHDNPKVSFH